MTKIDTVPEDMLAALATSNSDYPGSCGRYCCELCTAPACTILFSGITADAIALLCSALTHTGVVNLPCAFAVEIAVFVDVQLLCGRPCYIRMHQRTFIVALL